jgi:hypothetical protein
MRRNYGLPNCIIRIVVRARYTAMLTDADVACAGTRHGKLQQLTGGLRMRRNYRVPNRMIRIIERTRFTVVLFFVFSVIVYFFVGLDTCISWMSTATGYTAMHIVMTVEVLRMLYLYRPKDPDAQDQILQVRQLRNHSQGFDGGTRA